MTDDNDIGTFSPTQCDMPVLPVVAIVGRPNVGKSTLFNRLSGKRKAIVDDRPGVTRDCITVQVHWNEHQFTLVDTGGFMPFSKDSIEAAIREQVERAIAEADVVLFVCDAKVGVSAIDADVAKILRHSSVESLLVVNKLDHPGNEDVLLPEFYRLGLGDPIPVSAVSGRLSGNLLDLITAELDPLKINSEYKSEDVIKLVLVGRPNVGKSTLINKLAGFKVSIVNNRPGTTRDSTDTAIMWKHKSFLLIDTAGIRRSSRMEGQIEYYSSLRAMDSIKQASVALVLVDAVDGVTTQDARIMAKIIKEGCGMVIVVNKWDSVSKPKDSGKFVAETVSRFPFLRDFPIVTLSALTGSRVHRCLEAAANVRESRGRRIPTGKLNRLLEDVRSRVSAKGSGLEVNILYATQQGIDPPTFVLFADRPDLLSGSDTRHFEKCLRKEYDFAGSPMRIYWRSRNKKAKSEN